MYLQERIDAGVNTVDPDGNTIFHWAAEREISPAYLEKLTSLGANVNQTNNAGRLPLHSFLTRGWYNDDWAVCQLRWIIENTQMIDKKDVDGIRPLHIAAMMSEHFVKALLAAGADPSGKTAEHLTPLHLASRARHSNIVGLLCQQLRQRYGSDGMIACLNAVDKVGRSPLHYACKSGRPETVSLLLTTGADPWMEDHDGCTPMEACCEFEMEQELWRDSWRPSEFEYVQFGLRNIPDDWDHDVCGGLKIEDELRPWVRAGRISSAYSGGERRISLRANPGEYYSGMHSDKASTRLEEILDMLFTAYPQSKDNSAMQKVIKRCLETCTAQRLSYSQRCFRRMDEKLDPPAVISQSWERDEQQRLDGVIRFVAELYASSRINKQDTIDYRTAHHLLALREYEAVELLLCRGTCSPRAVGLIVRLLCKHGFARLLERVLSSKYPPPASAYTVNSFSIEELCGSDPALFIACERNLPNMEVVRLLVERVGVDINARSRTAEERDFIQDNFNVKSVQSTLPSTKN